MIQIPRCPWFKPFKEHRRYKFIRGGRGSGKTTHIAMRLVEIAYNSNVNILVCREIEKSTHNSVYLSVKKAIEALKLTSAFKFNRNEIICKFTGASFFFMGLRSDPDKILSMENLTFAWVEQAEKVTEESLKLLTPTVRARNSEIWFSWNARFPHDPVQVLSEKLRDVSIYDDITYLDNAFFPDSLEEERQICLKYLPEDYNHVWLGGYRDTPDRNILLAYDKLKQCVGLDDKLKLAPKAPRWAYAGLDVADGGADAPAYAIRRSAKVVEVKELPYAKNGLQIAAAVTPIFLTQRIAKCYYDVTGVGASIKSEFYRAHKEKRLNFATEPFIFGGAVKGDDRPFVHGISNGLFFSNQAAQGYWNLKLRLERTMRLIGGEKLDVESCFILPRGINEKILRELSQVQYERNSRDKVRIDKKGDEDRSPNCADAIMMSFVKDIERGLIGYV